MMNNQPQYKPVYYLQRPNSPKNNTNQSYSTKNLSLTMSIGANQNSSNFIPNFRTRQQLPSQEPSPIETPSLDNDMKHLIRENSTLKQQNQNLKRQLLRIRRQGPQAFRSLQKNSVPSSQSLSDLRGTIKRQTGEVKQLRMRLETVSNQIKLYQQIIQKMDERLKKLTHDNTRKGVQIDNLSAQLAKMEELKEKVNHTLQAYSDLQNKFNDHMLEWARWRQNWLQEKQAYQERIRQLERNKINSH